MTARISNILRLCAVSAGALASVATSKVESGDRANGGDGDCVIFCDDDQGPTCPPDEDCSDATPTGLYFGGTPLGDVNPFASEWPRGTAIGGQQTIRMYYDANAERPLDLPFDASLSSDALSIVSQGASSVTLRGDGAGAASLRITEAGTQLLYDRVSLEASAIDRIELVPAGNYGFEDFDVLDGTTSFALLAGSTTRLAAAMYSFNDQRLVDENMQFELNANVASDSQGYVDTVRVTPPTSSNMNVVVSAGNGVERTLIVPVVGSADTIGSYGSPSTTVLSQYLGSARRHCFRALAADSVVLGGSFVYQATSGIELSQADDTLTTGCVEVLATEVGTSQLTVTAAGAEVAFTIEVVEQSNAAAAAPTRPSVSAARLAGERAENAEALRLDERR